MILTPTITDPPPDGQAGFSLAELLVVTALVAVMAAVSVPATGHAIDAGRARDASGFVAARMRAARQQAAFRMAATGLVFDRVGDRWLMKVCVDGNGNGIRRADIGTGTDTCLDGPYDLAQMFPGVDIAVDPGVRGPEGEAGSADPVRFGSSNIASFSPEGSCTAGTLFLRSSRGRPYAVRVANTTGRTRILSYDAGTRTWRTG